MRWFLLAPLCLLLASGGCSKRDHSPASESNASSPPPPSARAIDACALVTAEEVEATQGFALKEAKSSETRDGAIAVSQCYLALPTAADSLALVVMQKTGEDPRDPRSVWNEIFHKEKKPKIGRDGKEKKQADPEKVEGLGDEAFWVGMQIGSTLYVLKNETVINISTGGPGDPAAKREKLKALAAVVLRSL